LFEVRFRAEVVMDREFDCLTKAQQREMINRLEANPEAGKPLRGPLKGYFRHRIGDTRIVYRIEGASVTIIAIGARRDSEVYDLATKRNRA
jgi:mRNA interferase RelE/StbE